MRRGTTKIASATVPGSAGSPYHARQSVAETDPSAGGLGCEPPQEQLLGLAIPTSSGTPGQETRSHRRRAFHVGNSLLFLERG